ncbi:MAG: DNA-binding response regulator [Caldilinea sp. CFX5]|nr:DNA-binding response regulator [Caldilinea sp. CFX5]
MGMKEKIRVLLVDDHPPFREGLRVLLDRNPRIQVVGEADDGQKALDQLKYLQPDVVILDCQLPDADGPLIATEMRKCQASVKLVALSAFDDPNYIRGVLGAGAIGYLLKNETVQTIIAAIEAVAQGKPYFSAAVQAQLAKFMVNIEQVGATPTAREREIVELLAEGLTNAQIGRQLSIAERTVAYHIENLLSKFGVENRTQIVVAAIRQGWLKV